MKQIKEYRLKQDLIVPQTLYINKGAEIVNLIDLGDNDVALITISDPLSTDTDLRTFQIYTTYSAIYENNVKYIGAFSTNRHVIEIL